MSLFQPLQIYFSCHKEQSYSTKVNLETYFKVSSKTTSRITSRQLSSTQLGTTRLKSCFCFFLPCIYFSGDAARRCQTSYGVATLLLMAPIDPWQNFTPIFGAVAFCMTNMKDFRTPLTSTSLTILSTYSSKKRYK